MSALWTSDEIVAATGGALQGERFAATGVSIDTRTLEPGDLFVALEGVRDGHEFVGEAMRKGAAGALIARAVEGVPAVLAPDTLRALQALGLAARDRAPNCRRAAVTGSVGKTSTTQAIAAALALAGPAHASVKSYNNHIGVPLTLARMPPGTERAVFEIGMNHAGEIAALSPMVRPHAALVTTVGPVHVENFADGETGVAHAKAEIFEGLQPGGRAILNADNRWLGLLRDAAKARGADIFTFGREGRQARLLAFKPNAEGALVEAELHGRRARFPIAQSAAHWGEMSLAVLLTAEALGVPLEVGMTALASFAPLEGRGREYRIPLARGELLLIDESYNANPISMRSAFATLGARPVQGRRIAVLTDMLELGPEGPAMHAALAEPIAAAKLDLVFTAGPLMRSLHEALPPERRGGWAESAAELAPRVTAQVRPGDAVVVKGSNGSKAALVADALRAMQPVEPGARV